MQPNDLYLRKYSLIAGGAVINEPLTIKFTIPFGDDENIDTAEIQVYNLQDSTINSIAIDSPVTLSAGYQNDYGVIFDGTLKKRETKWENVDKITTCKCIDAPKDYTKTVFKKTYGRNTNASVILKELAEKAGLKIGDIDLPIDFVYRSGKVLNGKIKQLMSEVAHDCKAKLHVNKNQVFVRDYKKGDNLGLAISKETGLIDDPEEIEEETTDEKGSQFMNDKKKIKGYKIKMLLNPRVTTDVIIVLTSQKTSGTFRVSKGKHIGDWRSTDWYTECEVVPL